MAYVYDENSFLAGIAVGRALRGWSTYSSWDPIIIIPPVTEKFSPIYLGQDVEFSITAMTDIVTIGFPSREDIAITEEFPCIQFAQDSAFKILELNERLVIDQVIYAYRLDKESKDVEYNEDVVYINADGAFTFAATVDHVYTSTVEAIDSGSMAALQIVTSDKENIQKVVIA